MEDREFVLLSGLPEGVILAAIFQHMVAILYSSLEHVTRSIYPPPVHPYCADDMMQLP